MAITIQTRRGTAAEWTAANPVLAAGEQGYETDTGKVKVGDGTTAWTALPYPVDDAAAAAVDAEPRIATHTAALARVDPGMAGSRGQQVGIGIDGAPVWQQTYNVKLFGAIGDGTLHPLSERYATLAEAQSVYPAATALTESIDRHATQLAVDTANAAGGGVVEVPLGIYLIPVSIKMKSKVTLRGAGIWSVLKLANGANTMVIGTSAPNMANPITDVVVEDLYIDGNKANQSDLSPSQNGVGIQYVVRGTVRRVAVVNTMRTGIYMQGRHLTVEWSSVQGVGITAGVGRSGIVCDSYPATVDLGPCTVEHCTVDDVLEHGIKIYPTGHGSMVAWNKATNCADRGFYFQEVDSLKSSYNTATACNIGFHFAGTSSVKRTGCSSTLDTATDCLLDGFLIQYMDGTEITGGRATGNLRMGMYLQNAPNSRVNGGDYSRNSTDTTAAGWGGIVLVASPDCQITGPACNDNGRSGAAETAGVYAWDSGVPSTGVIVQGLKAGNKAGGFQQYAVRTKNLSDYWVITGGDLRGNVTASISLVGANNVNASNIV